MSSRQKSHFSSVSHPRGAAIAPDDSVTFSWGNVGGNSFEIQNAALTLFSNGQGNFSGQISTTQQGNDTLRLPGIELHDANGLNLFTTAGFLLNAQFNQPIQNDSGTLFPAYMYGYITNAVLHL